MAIRDPSPRVILSEAKNLIPLQRVILSEAKNLIPLPHQIFRLLCAPLKMTDGDADSHAGERTGSE